MGLVREHIYTCRGRQRAVFLRPEMGMAQFGLEVQDGDEAHVEVCYDPVEVVRRGQGLWLAFDGGRGGAVAQATALRVHVARVDGWMSFKVVEKEGLADGR